MRFKNIFLTTLLLFLFVYLVWQLVFSNKGMISLFRFSSKKERLVRENKRLNTEKEAIEKKVSRMKGQSLDIDTLDEQARKTLGYSKDKEVIFVE